MPLVRRTAELVAVSELSASVRSLAFSVRDGGSFEYQSGQWVNIFLPGLEHRAYSLASAPRHAASGAFELAVTRVSDGPVSNALHQLAVGQVVEVEEPAGYFLREPDAIGEQALFVASGTGLAPIRAMLQEEMRKPEGPPMTLLFGCRTEKDILWRTELKEWASFSRFNLHVSLSRGGATWTGRTGYVQGHVEALYQELSAPHVYICGLSSMVKDVRRILKERCAVKRQRIHSERYD